MSLFPEIFYPDGLRDIIAYPSNGAYRDVDLTIPEKIDLYDRAVCLMRVDDIEISKLGNVQVAIKLISPVVGSYWLPSQQKTFNAISFGLASWGVGGGNYYIEHSRDIDG